MPSLLRRLLARLARLLGGGASHGPPAASPRSAPSLPAAHEPRARAEPEPQPALPAPRGRRAEPQGVGNLDRVETMTVVLECPEEEFLWRLARRIDAGDFEVPALPPTSLAALEMCSRPSADVQEVVGLITADPLLSSELLRTANSVLYATENPAATLQEATMRIGLRALRGLILSVSMRGVILGSKGLSQYGEEVWRQAQSVARIARAIARPLGWDPERAYVLGLLHDVGKVALLALLRREVRSAAQVSPALVGRVFLELHEQAGAAMAGAWKLPEELRAVAGRHHDLSGEGPHRAAAAFARLAHLLDLHLSLDDDPGFRALGGHEAFGILGADERLRWKVLQLARGAYAEATLVPTC